MLDIQIIITPPSPARNVHPRNTHDLPQGRHGDFASRASPRPGYPERPTSRSLPGRTPEPTGRPQRQTVFPCLHFRCHWNGGNTYRSHANGWTSWCWYSSGGGQTKGEGTPFSRRGATQVSQNTDGEGAVGNATDRRERSISCQSTMTDQLSRRKMERLIDSWAVR